MKYLCEKHCQILAHNSRLANRLWASSMHQGKLATTNNNRSLARTFYGTALEIAVLQLTHKSENDENSWALEQLTDSARALTGTLCTLDHFDEAEETLLYTHRVLMGAASQNADNHAKNRHTLTLLDEFKKRVVSLLKMRGKNTMAESLQMISQSISAKVRLRALH